MSVKSAAWMLGHRGHLRGGVAEVDEEPVEFGPRVVDRCP